MVASFYPLEYLTQRIGGERVTVENLTPTGAEPHEIELSAATTGHLADADLVVYLHGLAPAVDEAVAEVAGGSGLDVAPAARLARQGDLHFWLDPTRLADVAKAVANRLAEIDPADASMFQANVAGLLTDLHDLDGEFAAGLAHCASHAIVTGHEAFGYLADRYGLTQIGVSGFSPEEEPSPADLARVSQYVEQHHVSTIFTETLVSPAIAATVAAETRATTAVLDPLEGLPKGDHASDYLGIMRADLAALRLGLGCA